MKYNFSSQFLRILPPDTNFGQAWESLCLALLVEEWQDNTIIRLNPPDKGVDILHRAKQTAYQCKSDERGAWGSLGADESIRSLETATANRPSLSWRLYTFATNANYTGTAFTRIMNKARELNLGDDEVQFLGPNYWDDLCSKHFETVKHRFDYRVAVTEEQVVEAFRKARYFEKYVNEYKSLIENAKFKLIITNNRTPLQIEIPFSPELSVENCIDVAQELFGISLDWTNYRDLGTSAGPSISLTINGKAQGFSQKIKDLQFDADEGLQLWITIVWEDKRRDEGRDDVVVYHYLDLARAYDLMTREALTYHERREHTIRRTEELIEAMVWKAGEQLKLSNRAQTSA